MEYYKAIKSEWEKLNVLMWEVSGCILKSENKYRTLPRGCHFECNKGGEPASAKHASHKGKQVRNVGTWSRIWGQLCPSKK